MEQDRQPVEQAFTDTVVVFLSQCRQSNWGPHMCSGSVFPPGYPPMHWVLTTSSFGAYQPWFENTAAGGRFACESFCGWNKPLVTKYTFYTAHTLVVAAVASGACPQLSKAIVWWAVCTVWKPHLCYGFWNHALLHFKRLCVFSFWSCVNLFSLKSKYLGILFESMCISWFVW